MLALTRSTRATHALSLHARALSTIAHSTGSPSTYAQQNGNDCAPAETGAEIRQTRLASSRPVCMLVYPWDSIRSSAEGLAIARAVQDKYGPAKEIVFSRNDDSVNKFQPYLWLVYDDPNVGKRLPEDNAQITLHVADLPRSDGNVGLEEMMRGLGLHATDNKDPHHSSPSSTGTDPSQNTSDAPPEGYKALDVRVEWAHHGPREVVLGQYFSASHPQEGLRPKFAEAWLAFDGFSSESQRGPQTPNLFRAREKWRKLAPLAFARKHDDGDAFTEAEAVSPSSQTTDLEEVEAGTESMIETRTNEMPSREWVPITSFTSHSQKPSRPDSAPFKNIHHQDIFSASAPANPENSPFNAALAAAEATVADTTFGVTPTPMPAGTEETAAMQAARAKLSRRERILNLARQNARTPLPKLPEKSQPPPEAEEVDEESERQGKERTIRERLWRLVGGNY